eukprot:1252478-Rhodomonas_salina.2
MRVGTERAVLWYLERGMKVLTEGYDGTHHHKEETYRGACRPKGSETLGRRSVSSWLRRISWLRAIPKRYYHARYGPRQVLCAVRRTNARDIAVPGSDRGTLRYQVLATLKMAVQKKVCSRLFWDELHCVLHEWRTGYQCLRVAHSGARTDVTAAPVLTRGGDILMIGISATMTTNSTSRSIVLWRSYALSGTETGYAAVPDLSHVLKSLRVPNAMIFR